MSKFKIGLLIIFSVFIVIAVIVFAASKGNSGTPQNVPVTVWGFLTQTEFTQFASAIQLSNDKGIVVTYVQKNPATFENDFVNALANGNVPDVIMVTDDMLYQNENKILSIPYTAYDARTFKNNFIQADEIFLGSKGIWAMPFEVDPLVMYWNRDIFNNADISQAPQYWDEVLTEPAKLTVVDRTGTITQSAVALGEWNNVVNAKAIISNLLLQAGNPIVDTTQSPPSAALEADAGTAVPASEAAINFYTQFANPTSATYSWNRSEPDSLTAFLSGNLALYFGFASELSSIRAKNPNLNFDVTAMPQPRQNTNKVVFARLTGLAIVKQSKVPSSALEAIADMTSSAAATQLIAVTNLPPDYRSLLASAPTDPYQSVFYQSALVSSAWLDPNSTQSSTAFANMVESITSGQAATSDAVSRLNDVLSNLLANPNG